MVQIHYARAIAGWTGVLAVSGFHYRGVEGFLTVLPRVEHPEFRSFWSTGTGWGTISLQPYGLSLEVAEGLLRLRETYIRGDAATRSSVRLGEVELKHAIQRREGGLRFSLVDNVSVEPGMKLVLNAN